MTAGRVHLQNINNFGTYVACPVKHDSQAVSYDVSERFSRRASIDQRLEARSTGRSGGSGAASARTAVDVDDPARLIRRFFITSRCAQ